MGSKISYRKKPMHTVECTDLQENDDPCLIPEKKLKTIRYIGQGSYGVVFLGNWEKSNGQVIEVAVKVLKNASSNADKESLQEVKNMQRLNDLNIVKLFGITLTQPIQVAVELCDGGSLLNRLKDKQNPILLVTQLLNYAKQLCSGMAYLEAQHCIHRDLAARNVLLTNREKTIKISDFGLTRFLDFDQSYYKMQSNGGIPYWWCPPEAISDKKFSHQSDVWSFGVTLWEMFTYGAWPWENFTLNEVYDKLISDEKLYKPEKASDEIYNIMCSCWDISPTKRPTFYTLKSTLSDKKFVIGECNVAVNFIEWQTTLSDMNFLTNEHHRLYLLENGLVISKGEKVIVINESNLQIWFGQSKKTRKFGYFHKNRIIMSLNDSDESEEASMNKSKRTSVSITNNCSSIDKNLNSYEIPRAIGYENADKTNIELHTIGRTSLIIQIEGCHIVMYPQACDLPKLLEKAIDCCIGSPCDNVIRHLNGSFPKMEWITWRTETMVELQKHKIQSEKMHITKNYHKLLVTINNLRFKIYKDKNGYIINGPTNRVIYLWPINISEQSKQQIKHLRPFDVAFFCIHTLKHPVEVKEAFSLTKAQKTLLVFARNFSEEQQEKFQQNLISLGIKQEDFIVLKANQSYRHHMYKTKARRSILFQYNYQRWRKNTNDSERGLISVDNEGADIDIKKEMNNP